MHRPSPRTAFSTVLLTFMLFVCLTAATFTASIKAEGVNIEPPIEVVTEDTTVTGHTTAPAPYATTVPLMDMIYLVLITL